MLFECLAGTPPFRHEQEVELMRAHVEQPPPRISEARPELPPSLDEVVAKAMAKRPEERFGSASELIEAARAAIEPAPPVTEPAPPAPIAKPQLSLRLVVEGEDEAWLELTPGSDRVGLVRGDEGWRLRAP
jgi:serine/threonine-protein kinase